MLWGRVADSKLAGRKTVLLIGLLGTAVSAVGFGFSTNFWQALMFRIIGGITNGNVGVMRTMCVKWFSVEKRLLTTRRISEIVREKKYQSRAFLLLPMTFNIGVIIGPILGGVLSDPAGSYPSLFGNVEFFLKYPYATPNLLSGVFLTLSGLAIWLGLEETLDSLRGRKDFGIRVGEWLMGRWRSRTRDDVQYQPLSAEDTDVELSGESVPKTAKRRYTQRLAFRRIFTRNVSMTLAAHFFLAFHIGSFNSLWFTFLSTPVYDPRKSEHETKLPFRFTGGIGMQPRTIGVATAIFGVIGITMQLGLYPRISHRLGTILSWRLALLCFPFAYLLIPYLSVMPSTSDPPAAKNGPLLWIMIVVVLVIQVTGRTFALPGQAILVNNCSPHPSVLGTVHGLGQSVSSAARTIGPMTSGFVYGYGLNHGVVGVVFWLLSLVAVTGLVVSISVREGDGHEIWLEDDEEEP